MYRGTLLDGKTAIVLYGMVLETILPIQLGYSRYCMSGMSIGMHLGTVHIYVRRIDTGSVRSHRHLSLPSPQDVTA
jgi:hypothetical protein